MRLPSFRGFRVARALLSILTGVSVASCLPEPELRGAAGGGAEREAQIPAARREYEPLVALTWNVEWLGDGENGPIDEDRQLALAIDALVFANADLIGLQEVSALASAQALLQAMPGYALEVARY